MPINLPSYTIYPKMWTGKNENGTTFTCPKGNRKFSKSSHIIAPRITPHSLGTNLQQNVLFLFFSINLRVDQIKYHEVKVYHC